MKNYTWTQFSSAQLPRFLANALEWVLRDHFVRHYFDDFGQAIDMTNSICELLGVPLAPDKCEGLATIVTYLGIDFNTSTLHFHLPDDKIQSIIELLRSWEHKQECTKETTGILDQSSAAYSVSDKTRQNLSPVSDPVVIDCSHPLPSTAGKRCNPF